MTDEYLNTGNIQSLMQRVKKLEDRLPPGNIQAIMQRVKNLEDKAAFLEAREIARQREAAKKKKEQEGVAI